jgi:DNA polymerase-3 subunit gamma/tau
VGQQNIATTLQQAIGSDQLAQAYLFCGPRGVGKTSTARLFAKSINLKHDPRLVDFSYNIYELDAASNNQVDDIRNLNDQVRIPPQTGRFKVYIIDEVHMLSQSAFNAFLKTLEEPPPHAVFVLATTEKHKIIPTILSRCQVYDFKRISVADMISHLSTIADKEEVKYEKEALHVIADKADGALRDALSCFDLMVNFCGGNITYKEVVKNLNILDHDYYFKISEFINNNSIHDVLLTYDEIISKGFDGHLFLVGLSGHLRNLMVCKDERTLKILEFSDSIKQKLKEQSSLFETSFLTDLLSLISEADVNYKSSKNQRLHVEILLMKLCSFGAQKKKVENLEIIAPDFFDVIESTPSPSSEKLVQDSLHKSDADESNLNAENKQSIKSYSDPNLEKNQIVRPKSNLKIKKRSLTTSISGIRKQINKKTETDFERKEEQTLSSTKFSDAILSEKWLSFAESRKSEGKIGLHTTLTKSKPILNDDFSILFVIDSEVQRMELQLESQSLLDFLRSELNNGLIQLKLEVTSNDKPKLSQLTSKERFFQMAEKNPDLHLLKEEFNLDIEY